jgi:hypothetical protein
MVGSGARLTSEGVVFVAPSSMIQRIQSVRKGDEVWFSNSLVFLLVRIGDKPDINYPFYPFDLLRVRRWGLRQNSVTLPTHLGNRVHVHHYRNIVVGSDLVLRPQNKKVPPEPKEFSAYADFLKNTIGSVFENAGHPGRSHPFKPITTVSKGYDSTAVSALAAVAGCQDALTFVSHPEAGMHDDSGAEIAGLLGLEITEVPREAYLDLPGTARAEFTAGGTTGRGVPLAGAQALLPGRLVLLGDCSKVWQRNYADDLPALMSPDVHLQTRTSYDEIGFRTGCLFFDVPYAGAIHNIALRSISRSKEMEKWRVGGNYDRPIPRRIAEEAGVPRGIFGQINVGGIHCAQFGKGMNRESRESFDAFYNSQPIPEWFRGSRFFRFKDIPNLLLFAAYGLTRRMPGKKSLFRALLPLTLHSDRRFWDYRYGTKYLYLFHWGFEQIRSRYEPEDPESP